MPIFKNCQSIFNNFATLYENLNQRTLYICKVVLKITTYPQGGKKF